MAYAQWLVPSKTSGSGNDTVNVTAGADNTGRNSRQTTVTFKAANCQDVERTVIQAGKPEFVTIESAKSVDKAGVATLTITGTTNSSKLTFALASGGSLPLTLPSSYNANSVSTDNGAAISGDPGASAEFPFSIAFTSIGANPTIAARSVQLIVTDNAGNTATCAITQAAGDATLSVSPASVQLDWNAATAETSASFTVTSNTNWTIE
jgi:hypothetical protein